MLILVLAGCSTISQVGRSINSYLPWATNNEVEKIHIVVAPDPSINRAIMVDAIFVYKQESKTVIDALEPKDWFAQRNQFMANLSNTIDVISWEVVPAIQQSSTDLPDNHRKAIAVYIFANNPNNKVEITEMKNPIISLDSTSISLEP